MKSEAIIPGKLYKVTFRGAYYKIIASDGLHAIRLALDIIRERGVENWRVNA